MQEYVAFANDLAAQWAGAVWSVVWQSTVLAAALVLLARLLKRAPASLRYWIWMLVPLRLLVMPVLSISLPVLPAPSPDIAVQTQETIASGPTEAQPAPVLDEPPSLTFASAEANAAAPSPAEGEKTHPEWPVYVMIAWGAGVLFLSIRMARGWWWMRRLVAEGETIMDGPLVDAACRAVGMLGLKGLPRLVVTDANVSPFTCGVRRPVVVLPKAFVHQVNPHGLLAVLAHEFAHLRRYDSLFGIILGVCDTLYFFHPVVCLVKRQIFFEREKACDDLVLAMSKAKPSAYANAICVAAQVSRSTRPLTSPPVLVAESFSDLKGRLSALASGVAPRAKLSKASLVSLVALGVLCVPGIMLTASRPAAGVARAAGVPDAPVALQALASSETRAEREQPATRVIHFPEDHALGVVSVRRAPITRRYRLGPDYSAVDRWDVVAEARGDVAVPAGKEVKLTIAGQAVLQDQSPLERLKPRDLDALEIYCPDEIQAMADSRIMPYLSGLTGLKDLDLHLPDLTDRGMARLDGLTALKVLHLWATGVTDAAYQHLQGMQSLEALWSWTTLTDDGLAPIGRLSSLRELSINVTNIRGPGLTHLAQLPALEHLELEGENFGNSGLQYLRELPRLRSLWLRGEGLRVSNGGMRYLGELSGLEELRLARLEGVTDAGLVYLEPLRSLRLLELGKSITTDAALETLSEMQSLEELTLSNNPKSVLTDAGLSYLPRLKNLKRLDTMGWSQTPISDAGLEYLSTMSTLRDLQICGGEGITDTGIGRLARLSRLENLSLLTDSHHVTNRSLAHIGTLRNLRSLYICCTPNPFTTSGLNELNGLANLEFLSISGATRDDAVLDLSGLTRLEDATITMRPFKDADLASLGKLTRLRRLQGLMGIGDAGLASLAGLTELQMLSISDGHLTDEGLRHLENMKKLDCLIISGGFTARGAEFLEAITGLRVLTITNTARLEGQELDLAMQALERLKSKLPNLMRLSVNGGPVSGYGAG